MVHTILTWLTANIGFVTLLVGGFAIFLYLKQKRDKKRDAANLIVQEVRYAETQVRNYRASKTYPLSSTILPTRSWNENIHLFVSDLSESEIDLISTFYSQAAFVDNLINEIATFAMRRVETQGIEAIPQLAMNAPVPLELTPQQPLAPQATPAVPNVMVQEIRVTRTLHAHTILNEVSERIEFIFNSPAIDKLIRISKRKWYLLWI